MELRERVPSTPSPVANFDATGTRWLILQTDTSSYTNGTIELFGSGGDFGYSIGSATVFVPAAAGLPEPLSVALLPLAVGGLLVRIRRR